MAQLWIDDAGEWAILPLERPAYGLEEREQALVVRALSDDAQPQQPVETPCRLVRLCHPWLFARWALTAGPAGIKVNGVTVHSGIRLLRDRDQLRLGRHAVAFFSAESLPKIETFAHDDGDVFCPRCRAEIQTGEAAVRCPSPECGVWHHQAAAKPCWTYAATCAACSQPTNLDGGFRWTPDDL